jgi:WD40 repeat protein
MITASDNGEIFTWNLDNEEPINKYSNEFRCNSISYNRADSTLVFAGVKSDKNDKKIYQIATCDITEDMWSAVETEKGKAIPLEVDETINTNEIIDIAQNRSGRVFIEENRLVVGGDEAKFDKAATTLATNFDSDDVYVGFKDGSILKYGGETVENEIECPVTKIKISGDNVIAGYENGSIKIMNLDLNGSEIIQAHEKAVTNIYVDESHLISLGKDNTIKFWDIDSKECRYTYFLDIFATSISLEEGKLVVGDALGNVRFFEFKN